MYVYSSKYLFNPVCKFSRPVGPLISVTVEYSVKICSDVFSFYSHWHLNTSLTKLIETFYNGWMGHSQP